jgi:serine/threonine-protein kinase HipA
MHSFTYAETWLHSDKVRSLSLSLPITSAREIRGPVVGHFFNNLLPDNERIRERIARRFRIRDTAAFSLLEAIGRDCVGAVQLLPETMTPVGWNRIDCEPLTAGDIKQLLRQLSAGVPGEDIDADAFRISIAGAQEKTALVYIDGRWCRPQGATPTTHILKLPLGIIGGARQLDLSDSVENEWLCAQLVTALGLPVAQTDIANFDGQKALVVERFDRDWMDGGRWIARLPQEDFCQALGFPPEKKYEADGGPGMAACLNLLSGSADAAGDRAAFVLTQFAFWLLAACDGHAKNYSLFLHHGDRYVATPLYDILSFWPYIGNGGNQVSWRAARLAMAIHSKNTHAKLYTLQARHWHELAMKNGGSAVWNAVQALAGRVDEALAVVERQLPRKFPARMWQAISAGMRSQADGFRAGLAQR